MSLPSPLPLDAFERAIMADPEALGVFYFGSLGCGTATRYSDLDIFVVVPDAIAEPYQTKLVPLLQLFGEVHWLDIPNGKGFVGPGWNQVDIEMARLADLEHERSYRFAGATVLKDRDGFLAAFVASCEPESVGETPAGATTVIRETLSDLLYATRNNARGAIWEAGGSQIYQCARLYELLARLRGRRTYGFRYVDQILTPEEHALMAAVWPRELSQADNRRATLALYKWIKHVWREAERVLGQPLDLHVDEASLLAALDAMYDSRLEGAS